MGKPIVHDDVKIKKTRITEVKVDGKTKVSSIKFLMLSITSVITDMKNDGVFTLATADNLMVVIRNTEYGQLKKLVDEGLSNSTKTWYKSAILDMLIPPEAAIRIGTLGAKLVLGSVAETARNAALTAYFKTEFEVKEFDQSLTALASKPIFSKVRARMRYLLQGFSSDELASNCRLSSGATSTPGASSNTAKETYVSRQFGRMGLPENLHEYFRNRGLLDKVSSAFFEVSRYGSSFKKEQPKHLVLKDLRPILEKVTTVPKNTEKERVISTYPHNVVFVTNSANDHLSEIIHQQDRLIEFTYQEKCSNALASFADTPSNYNRTATIDFTDCSGLISWALLTTLIDNQDVLEFLDAVRGHHAVFHFKVRKPVVRKPSPITKVPIKLSYTEVQGNIEEPAPIEVQQTDYVTLIREQFPSFPIDYVTSHFPFVISPYGENNESTLIELTIPRYSHAGMGSGVTFPIMAALIGAITYACGFKNYRVFGDDVILMDVDENDFKYLLNTYKLFGLKVNMAKTCPPYSVVKECVGAWFTKASNDLYTFRRFTPMYLRKDLTPLFSLEKCDDLSILHYAVELTNYLSYHHSSFAVILANRLLTSSVYPIMFVQRGSGKFGIEVEEPWRYYNAVVKLAKDGKNTDTLSVQRLLVGDTFAPQEGSLAHKSSTVLYQQAEYQSVIIPFKAVLAKPFINQGSEKWVDDEDVISSVYPDEKVDLFTTLFSNFKVHRREEPSWIINDELGSLQWQVQVVNSIVKQESNRCKLSDRPEDERAAYLLANDYLTVPSDVVQSWLARVRTL